MILFFEIGIKRNGREKPGDLPSYQDDNNKILDYTSYIYTYIPYYYTGIKNQKGSISLPPCHFGRPAVRMHIIVPSPLCVWALGIAPDDAAE